MLTDVPSLAAVEPHDSTMAILDIETHVRRTSHLARALFLLTRSDLDFSDKRDRSALDALADEIASHASAAEHLLDVPTHLNVVALEEHVRDASHLARVLFQFTRSLVNYSDTRDFDGLRTLADKTFDDAIAAEQLLDGRRVA